MSPIVIGSVGTPETVTGSVKFTRKAIVAPSPYERAAGAVTARTTGGVVSLRSGVARGSSAPSPTASAIRGSSD
ncbi:MAG: hypothetical protein ACKOTB_14835 [Planctomycetia bacterium]